MQRNYGQTPIKRSFNSPQVERPLDQFGDLHWQQDKSKNLKLITSFTLIEFTKTLFLAREWSVKASSMSFLFSSNFFVQKGKNYIWNSPISSFCKKLLPWRVLEKLVNWKHEMFFHALFFSD